MIALIVSPGVMAAPGARPTARQRPDREPRTPVSSFDAALQRG
jgi:hypothetical protein